MKKKKIHLVFDPDYIESLVEVINNFAEVTGKDFNMDTAAQWAASKKGPDPDIILIEGTVDVSKVDFSSGKIARDKYFIERLTQIRVNRPNSQIIVLLQEERKSDIAFLQAITGLAVFDIYFVNNFNESDLQQWFNTQKNVADVTHMLPGVNLEDSELSKQKSSYAIESPGEDVQEKTGVLSKLLNTVSSVNKDVQQKLSKNKTPETELPIQEKENPSKVKRTRTGIPTVVLGIGEPRIEDWIKNNYEGRLKVLDSTVNPEDFQQKVSELSPDLVILMRQSILGGIEQSDNLAIWSAKIVPVVLFIVGELDQIGLDMVNNARKAGIQHIISCEKGGQLAGDDFNFAIAAIIREFDSHELQLDSEKQDAPNISSEAKKSLNSLFKGSLKALSKTAASVADTSKEKAHKKISKPKIKSNEGISFDEQPESEIYSTQVLKNPTAIVSGGIFAIVSPWKPNLAGRLAAQAVKMFQEIEGGEVAYIGASAQSTGAIWLDVSDEELMMADWRVPGSNYPIVQGNVKLYAVDPAKNLRPNSESDLWSILKDVRKTATYTVIDLAGEMDLTQKVAHQGRAVVLVIIPGNDPVEQRISTMWLKNLMDGKQNIVTGIDLRGVPAGIPEELKPKVVVRNNPADSLVMVLRKNNNDEFHWN